MVAPGPAGNVGPMSSVTVHHTTTAAPSEVWAFVVDMDRWVDAIEGIDAVERLDDGEGFGVGTRWRETRTMFGQTATEDMEVTEYEEGARYATFAESHGSKYHSELRVEPRGTGSEMTMSFTGEPQSLFAKVMDVTVGRLFMGSTRKAFARDLADIAAAVEEGA